MLNAKRKNKKLAVVTFGNIQLLLYGVHLKNQRSHATGLC
jgi:hypothetical protein